MIMEERPRGFRFFPTEEELVCFYLRHKLQGDREDIHAVIPVVNIYHHCPWDLPHLAGELSGGDPEQWFFFVDMQENMAAASRGKPNRLTAEGYWKGAGSSSVLYSPSNNQIMGVKKTMIFYKDRAPHGRKTDWKMNEYKAILGEPPPPSTAISDIQLCHEFSLCRIYNNARLDRGFDRRPSAIVAIAAPEAIAIPAAIPVPEVSAIPAAIVAPEAIAESSSSHHLQIGTSLSTMPELGAILQAPDEDQHPTLDDQNMECDNLWDVCVPLWDWERMGF